MVYKVIEIQSDGTNAQHLVTTHSTEPEAESKFCLVRSAAAVSNVPIHSVMKVTDTGVLLDSKCYQHGSPAPEVTVDDNNE